MLSLCSGVKIAIDRVLDVVGKKQNKEIYMLGNMVHNEYVVGYLEEKGIKVTYDIEAVPEEVDLCQECGYIAED